MLSCQTVWYRFQYITCLVQKKGGVVYILHPSTHSNTIGHFTQLLSLLIASVLTCQTKKVDVF